MKTNKIYFFRTIFLSILILSLHTSKATSPGNELESTKRCTATSMSPDIRNSHHDFSGASWSGNQICSPCHVPHNGTCQ